MKCNMILVIKRLLKVIGFTCSKENICFFWKQVISSKNNNGNPELELYPITVKLLRHQIVAQRPAPTSFTGVMSGIGGMALSKFYICEKITQQNTLHWLCFFRDVYEFWDNGCLFLRYDKLCLQCPTHSSAICCFHSNLQQAAYHSANLWISVYQSTIYQGRHQIMENRK